MDIILYFFRDTISGTYYFMYAFICLILMFSLIGYLFKDKYAKVAITVSTETKEVKQENKSVIQPKINEVNEKPLIQVVPKQNNVTSTIPVKEQSKVVVNPAQVVSQPVTIVNQSSNETKVTPQVNTILNSNTKTPPTTTQPILPPNNTNSNIVEPKAFETNK